MTGNPPGATDTDPEAGISRACPTPPAGDAVNDTTTDPATGHTGATIGAAGITAGGTDTTGCADTGTDRFACGTGEEPPTDATAGTGCGPNDTTSPATTATTTRPRPTATPVTSPHTNTTAGDES